MRKILWLFCLSLIVMIPLGCAPAKKPEPQPEPRTIVVPDVSRITFETIDYDKAPEIVQVLARTLKDKHFAAWTSVNGRNYVIVSQKNLPLGRGIQITEIERRVPANDFDWINVKLKYLPSVPNLPTGQKPDPEKPVVAAFTIDRPVKALGFEMEREAPQARTPAAPPAPPAAPGENTGAAEKGLKLDSPKPGEQVRSPLQVSGTASGVTGAIRIRVKNAAGLTLAEKPVQINGSRFATTMSFSSPSGRERGTVEAFVTGDDGVEKDTVSVPVILLPGVTGEPEPIGAP
ncbi:Gmad2 immunoglobulin-like domain-containing protein [Desulforamulus putei]|uniref:Immunoglobulin-like domain of spore germination n=1 Tax=Desulforamulus putei DSM 12395 TaxID=1121429 RepID=A0A1M4YES0_9FIRM|nr:Gmad2 immunoglobulin-like domain-containing protein [Desulforamulus putei]SHF04240.1 Immunoglobulin-like domain of spore germination [Desulforamulus putei DSM 12395]